MEGWSSRRSLAGVGLGLLIAMSSMMFACSECDDIGCTNQIRFQLGMIRLERQNTVEARICFDNECKKATAHFTRGGVGDSGNSDIEISLGGGDFAVSLQLPSQAQDGYDSRTEHEASLELVVNDQPPVDLARTIVLKPYTPGCHTCWGSIIKVGQS
jgi:hypothetical protein